MRALRVGVIGPAFPDSFADNIATALEDLGHFTVKLGSTRVGGRVTSRVSEFVTPRYELAERLSNRRITSVVQRSSLDLVVTVEGGSTPGFISELKDHCGRVALWFPDSVANLGRQMMFLAPYDAVCFKDPWIVDRARTFCSFPVYYLPEACNVRWHAPPADCPDPDGSVAVVGNLYASRLRTLELLASANVPIKIYGPLPPRWLRRQMTLTHTEEYVARDRKAWIFRSAGVVLNSLHPSEVLGMNCRLFEATGCGGAVLSEYREELPTVFRVGTEVKAYQSGDELIDTARAMLANPDVAREMGDRACIRAHTEHNYAERLRTLLTWLFGDR